MTPAERQQRRRQRLNAYPQHPLPWDDSVSADRAEAVFIDQLYTWLARADAEEVGPWLAFVARGSDRWLELDAIVRRELEERQEAEFRD